MFEKYFHSVVFKDYLLRDCVRIGTIAISIKKVNFLVADAKPQFFSQSTVPMLTHTVHSVSGFVFAFFQVKS